MITEDDLRWWLDLAPSLDWTFAKSMPDTPHCYVVRGRHLRSDHFYRAVRVIKTFGEPGKFYSRTNLYLTDAARPEPVKWWVMSRIVEENGVINQAAAQDVYGDQDAPVTHTDRFTIYDAIASEYDARYATAAAEAENIAVWKLITERTVGQPTLLDVGCGTGLALDIGLTKPSKYVGVDPSHAMLNELVLKHPSVHRLIPSTIEEALDFNGFPEKFDVVLSLFGSPSHVSPDAITTLADKASRLAVFMHYEDGYLPDFYVETPKYYESSRQAAAALLDTRPGFRYKLGHFDVTVVDRLDRR